MPAKSLAYDRPAPAASRQPLKALSFVALLVHLALQSLILPLVYLMPSLRLNARWTIVQNVAMRNTQVLVSYLGSMRAFSRFKLSPTKAKNRLQRIEPGDSGLYRGVLSRDEYVQPVALESLWFPEAFNRDRHQDKNLVLHLHGGAFTMGPEDDTLHQDYATDVADKLDALMFVPIYRRTSVVGNHFPAQLQDALTSYAFVVKQLGIAPHRLILSGDSAGANLAMGLMKYLQEAQSELPLPCAAILISPWIDLTKDADFYAAHPNRRTDYLIPNWMDWSTHALIPEGLARDDPYVSPGLYPRPLPVPTWVELGECEILAVECREFFEACCRLPRCEKVDVHVVPDGIHDSIIIGRSQGHVQAVEESVKKVVSFIQEVMS